jgi:hypothetical protein
LDAAGIDWLRAVFDTARLFGFWGLQLENHSWPADAIFEHPHGLAWFIRGGQVAALGRDMAQMEDGRVLTKLTKLKQRTRIA